MADSIKGTQTEKNLLAAFAGESQARNRYTYFASAARKAGLEHIANVFAETAENEKEHAKVFFKHLQGGEVTITAGYPAGVIGETADNLKAAADGEKMEWGTIYPQFAKVAREEGFGEVAAAFANIAKAEQFHEERYRKLLASLQNGGFFSRTAPVKWHCINCGFVAEGKDAPKVCPACKHPQAFYEVLAENW